MRRAEALGRLLVALLVLWGSCGSHGLDAAREAPLIIAHRGASFYAPEHSLVGYRLALELGADVIEPDLQLSKDGAFVISHNPTLDETTDVAEKFPARRTTRVIDGLPRTGVFASDLTAAEIRTLRLRQRIASRDHSLDGLLPVLFLEDALDAALNASASARRPLGVYPELKHPSHYASLGFDPCGALAAALRSRGLPSPAVRVYVQCFEAGPLRACRAAMKRSLAVQPLFVQLVEKAAAGPPWNYALDGAGLDAIAEYAEGIGAAKALLLAPPASERDPAPACAPTSPPRPIQPRRVAWAGDGAGDGVVEAAHGRGLLLTALLAPGPDQAAGAGGPKRMAPPGPAVAAAGAAGTLALVAAAVFLRRRLRQRQDAQRAPEGYESLLEMGAGPDRPQARAPGPMQA
eukprot:tig00000663_g2988.t1